MSKKIIFTAFILFLLVLTACNKGGGEVRPITDADVRKGTSGLEMNFLANAPPESVFEDSIFPIAVEIRNRGAFDVGSEEIGSYGKKKGILVFGLEKAYVDFDDKTKVKMGEEEKLYIEIKGKSVFNPKGDDDVKDINVIAKNIGEQSELHPTTILATACYPYETILGTSVCVDPDIYDMRRGEKACSIKDVMFSEGQGAPVVITKIETNMLPDVDENKVKPHFFIYIENKGNGEVVDLSVIDKACSNEPIPYNMFNSIRIRVSLSGEFLDCDPKGDIQEEVTVRLREGEDIVRCTFKEGISRNLDAYTSPLKVELEYGYTFTISKEVVIEKILEY